MTMLDILLVVFAGSSGTASCISCAPWEYPANESIVFGHFDNVVLTSDALFSEDLLSWEFWMGNR